MVSLTEHPLPAGNLQGTMETGLGLFPDKPEFKSLPCHQPAAGVELAHESRVYRCLPGAAFSDITPSVMSRGV